MSDLRAKLNDVFRDVFNDKTLSVTDATTARDIDGWDSINHVNLIVAVEHAFKIKLSTREATALADVGELVRLIERKLAV